MVGEVVFFSVVLCVGADVVGDDFTTVEFCPRASANQWLDLRKMKRGGEVENTEKRGGGRRRRCCSHALDLILSQKRVENEYNS